MDRSRGSEELLDCLKNTLEQSFMDKSRKFEAKALLEQVLEVKSHWHLQKLQGDVSSFIANDRAWTKEIMSRD